LVWQFVVGVTVSDDVWRIGVCGATRPQKSHPQTRMALRVAAGGMAMWLRSFYVVEFVVVEFVFSFRQRLKRMAHRAVFDVASPHGAGEALEPPQLAVQAVE
jgi:hypothetical protein